MRDARTLLSLFGLLLLLAAGCGQKGELYLESAQPPPTEQGNAEDQQDDERDGS